MRKNMNNSINISTKLLKLIIMSLIIILLALTLCLFIKNKIKDKNIIYYNQYSLVTDATKLVQIPLVTIRGIMVFKENNKDSDYIFKVLYSVPETEKRKNLFSDLIDIKEQTVNISKNTMLDYFGNNSVFFDPEFEKITMTNCINLQYTSCQVDYWMILEKKHKSKKLAYSSQQVQQDLISLFNLYVLELNLLKIDIDNNGWYFFKKDSETFPESINIEKTQKTIYTNQEQNNIENIDINSEEFMKKAPDEMKELIKKDQEKKN